MARKRGRPADDRHRRMRLILGALARQAAVGVSRTRLEREVGFEGPDAERKLRRDLSDLRKAGWDIRSVPRSDGHVYVLHVVDTRLRRHFTDAERAELLRAAQGAGLGQIYEDLGSPGGDGAPAELDGTLGDVHRAVSLRCLLRFTYKAKPRVVDPHELVRKERGWLLRGLDLDGGESKLFYVNQMGDVEVDRPGTAGPVPDGESEVNLNPLFWRVHEPVEVVLATRADDVEEVMDQLGGQVRRLPSDNDASALLTIPVTNTDGFLSRLFELDSRVRLVGPEVMRTAARRRLQQITGNPS